MTDIVQDYIEDARRFAKCGDYELAISPLQLAQKADQHKAHEVEVQKLFSFNYRKMRNFDMALLHINNSINRTTKDKNSMHAQNEYAICLMNKGLIYEECHRNSNALDCYSHAVDSFISLYKSNPDEHGIIINTLITLGLFYYKQCSYVEANGTFELALPYFGAEKETDQRYLVIRNILQGVAR